MSRFANFACLCMNVVYQKVVYPAQTICRAYLGEELYATFAEDLKNAIIYRLMVI